MKKNGVELVRGSGNVFRDFGYPDADIHQAKAILAAKIIGVLDKQEISVRKPGRLEKIWLMPTASDTAPPARPARRSPICSLSSVRLSVVMPRAANLSGGVLMAK